MFDSKATVVAELTPSGRGAVAVVVVAGPNALHAVSECFVSASGIELASATIGRILFGRWGEPGGEELVVCRRADDEIEVHCHGGEAAVRAVIGSLVDRGCQRISWQEWLRSGRANSANRAQGSEIDAICIDAQIALAEAPTARTAAILLDQLDGALSTAVRDAIAAVTAADWSRATDTVNRALEFADLGLHLTRPWRVVLSGPPNVGKSSLMNAIAGFQRAIVSPQPGTTRDVVTLATAIEGWPVEFADTAGLRTGQDAVETAGIALAEAAVANADLVLVVSEPDRPQAGPGSKMSQLAVGKELQILNKFDLMEATRRRSFEINEAIAVSAVTGEGIETLLTAIAGALVPCSPPPRAAVPFTLDQVNALAASHDAIASRYAASARDALQAMLSK